MDQAATLRTLKKVSERDKSRSRTKMEADDKGRFIRVIAITSGKGGVGKTNITANLAYILSSMGKKTLILDADMGLANIDLILGLTPEYNLYHVLKGEKKLSEIIIRGPGGIMILPSSSGVQEMADLSRGYKLALLDELNNLREHPDFMLIDTAAGIAGNVMYFNMAAKEIVVVTSPEPTSLTDAYALMKVLFQTYGKKRFHLLVNMVKTPQEAKEVFRRLHNATDHFLNIRLDYLGYVLRDEKFQEAIQFQKALADLYPTSLATGCLQRIAERLCQDKSDQEEDGSVVFFRGDTINHGHG